jgi:aspartate/methionine/tyrosine aminotransferase
VFPQIDYLAFMMRWSGRARYDLATSGISPISAQELGAVHADDFSSRARFVTAIARYYGVPEREVVPCLGTSGALFTAYSLLESGERVLLEHPSYEPLSRIAQALGHSVDHFSRAPEAGFGIEIGRVLEALRPDTRLVVVSNPHNPTGVLSDDPTLSELARELERRNVRLLVDEVYLEAARPARSAHQLDSNVLTCSSATKCWGVPWARAGWLLLPAELAVRAAHVERYTTGLAPPGSWAWGERAVEKQPELHARAERLQAGKRALVEQFVDRNAARLSWSAPPPTTPFAWFADRRERSLTALLEHAAETRGVLVAPGEFFGEKSAFRLGWTGDITRLRAGLLELERVLPA